MTLTLAEYWWNYKFTVMQFLKIDEETAEIPQFGIWAAKSVNGDL